MATDVRCDACGGTFQHEGAGPSAQCPYCQATVNVPSEAGPLSSAPASAPSAASPSATEKPLVPAAGAWHVYTCDGQRFGPITKEELDRWAEEKRLTASCQVYQDGW